MSEILNDANVKKDKSLRRELRSQAISYLLGAFGLVAGLAWNDAIKATIESIFPLDRNGLQAKFIYALIVTVFVVFFTFYISKFLTPKDEARE